MSVDNKVDSTKVGVIARVRPFLDGESTERCINVESSSIVLHQADGPSEQQQFAFDRCYADEATQDALFDAEIAPIIKSTVCGFNGTVFCYGVTGSGKTYTMDGIFPRTVEACLAEAPRVKLFVSYFEILNERSPLLLTALCDATVPQPDLRQILDLLHADSLELQIRVAKDGQVIIQGAAEKLISSTEQFEELKRMAASRRATAATNSNSVSSRSHAVLRLRLQTSDTNSVLNLIDLAGSEDNRVTGNTGARLIESSNINRSLFNLGKVIDALNKKAKHVPYRESKLTRVLQDSLGGRAHTLMIVNLPPGVPYYHHVLNTLQFAAKSRNIVNKPVVVQQAAPPTPSMADKLAAFREKKGLTPVKRPESNKRKISSVAPAFSPAPPKQARLTLSGACLHQYEASRRSPLAAKPLNEFGLADGGALLLTPQAKLKQAREYVSKGIELEMKGENGAALVSFTAAAKLVPTDKLSDKISQISQIGSVGQSGAAPMCNTSTAAVGATHTDVRNVLENQILLELNSCCVQRLSALKDIGPKRQLKVQQWVAQHGGFNNVAQLNEIGMSSKQVENFLKKNVLL